MGRELFERGQFVQGLLFGVMGQFVNAGSHSITPVGRQAREVFLDFPTRFAQQDAFDGPSE